MAKLLGIDVGTSGCKALLVNEEGTVLKEAHAEYPISVPQPMWSEQNPADWWNGVCRCLEAIGEPEPDAIGVTGQMHGAVFLDKDDQVIRPAILWNDQRTVAECEEIDRMAGADRVRAITCNPPMTGFQAPKLLWLRNHEPEHYAQVRSVLLPKDYIRFMLTGVKATEVSDASGVGLLDVPKRVWSDELLDALKLDRKLFPECFESYEISSHTLRHDFIKAGIPVAGGGGDQAAAAVGTGAVEPGVISVSLGTSGVVFTALPSPHFDPGGAAHTFCHANGGWHAMGVMLSCGGALRWYRDTIAAGSSYDNLAAEAATVPPGAEGATFLPYLTGERCPHNDPFARAAFAGLTLGHTRAHMSRAVFEGVSCGLKECMDLLVGLGAVASEVRVNGGGAKSGFWVQMLADMFRMRCVSLKVDEGPAFGAAILGGVGIGVWDDVATACHAAVRTDRIWTEGGVDYGMSAAKYRSLYPLLHRWGSG